MLHELNALKINYRKHVPHMENRRSEKVRFFLFFVRKQSASPSLTGLICLSRTVPDPVRSHICRCASLSIVFLHVFFLQVVCGSWWSMAITVDGYCYSWGCADGGWTGLALPKGLSVVDPGPANDRCAFTSLPKRLKIVPFFCRKKILPRAAKNDDLESDDAMSSC